MKINILTLLLIMWLDWFNHKRLFFNIRNISFFAVLSYYFSYFAKYLVVYLKRKTISTTTKRFFISRSWCKLKNEPIFIFSVHLLFLLELCLFPRVTPVTFNCSLIEETYSIPIQLLTVFLVIAFLPIASE